MKKILLSMLILIMTSLSLNAAVQYRLEDFLDDEGGAGVGFLSIDNRPFVKTSLSPNFKFNSFILGLDFNLYIPTDGNDSIPDGLDWVVFRKVGYDHKSKYGFEWGRLTNMRFGYGMVMDDYDTGAGGTSEFDQNKTGLYTYATFQNVKIKALISYLNTQAVRVEAPFENIKMFGAPLTLGATYVTDTDGVSDSVTGATRSAETVYGADVGLPISEQFTPYAEAANIENRGSGFSAGFLGAVGDLDYKAEYRYLEAGFVPGYFSPTYEATSFNFDTDSLQEDVSGILVSAKTTQLNGNVLAGAQYELYDEVNRLTAAVGWKNVSPLTGVINYAKEFSAGDDTLGTAIMDFYYVTGKWYDLVGQYKWVFLPNGETDESYSVGIRVVPEELFPDFL
ncbi:MAG: hypothetical protein CMP39_00345 [Rickettsiales bacterium]|nr:hypothetical protein [Rickettsiales bacterium]